MADPTTPGDIQPPRSPAASAEATGPAGRSRVWVALGVVAALASVAAVAGALIFGGDGARPAAVNVDPVIAAKDTQLVVPQTLNGQPKIVDAELQAVADQLRSTILSVVPGSLSSEVGFYGNMTDQDLLMIVAVTAPIADPASQLSNALTSLAGSGITVNAPAPVDAGPLGGQSACGDATASGVEVAVCAWADSGSLGVVMFYFTDLAEAKQRFAQVRAEVEKR